MRYLFNTKPALWFFNRYFNLPLDATVVGIGKNSIHFTNDFKTFKCRSFQNNLLDFPVLKRIQQFALIPFALASKGFAFLLLTDTSATNNKDAAISQYTPTTSYGTTTDVGYVASQTGGDDWKFFIHFTLPSGSGTISNVTLNLYRFGGFGTNTGLNLEVREMTRTNWTNACTWNKYDGTNNWTLAGGDYSATIVDSIAHNTSNNVWRVWDIGASATNPIAGLTWGSDVHLAIVFSSSGANPAQAENMRSRDDASNQPYIEITYTAGGAAFTPRTSFFM